MKIAILIALALCASKSCNGAPSCRSQIYRYTREHFSCAENGIVVHGLAEKIATKQMTYDELKTNIATMCERADTARCHQKISEPIDDECENAEKLQHFRNSLKVILTFDEYLCQNNGSKYLKFVANGGAECYYNEMKAECYASAKRDAGVEQHNQFKDDSICLLLEADTTCAHHYDRCENRYVKSFYSQVLRSLKEQFSC